MLAKCMEFLGVRCQMGDELGHAGALLREYHPIPDPNPDPNPDPDPNPNPNQEQKAVADAWIKKAAGGDVADAYATAGSNPRLARPQDKVE